MLQVLSYLLYTPEFLDSAGGHDGDRDLVGRNSAGSWQIPPGYLMLLLLTLLAPY